MTEILKLFSSLIKAAEYVVAEHYERNFDMIFHFLVALNLVADHYARDFDMIFHFKVAQNLVAEHF